jgi:hypothetical protein
LFLYEAKLKTNNNHTKHAGENLRQACWLVGPDLRRG